MGQIGDGSSFHGTCVGEDEGISASVWEFIASSLRDNNGSRAFHYRQQLLLFAVGNLQFIE